MDGGFDFYHKGHCNRFNEDIGVNGGKGDGNRVTSCENNSRIHPGEKENEHNPHYFRRFSFLPGRKTANDVWRMMNEAFGERRSVNRCAGGAPQP